jgi:hypothetical protein
LKIVDEWDPGGLLTSAEPRRRDRGCGLILAPRRATMKPLRKAANEVQGR